METSEERKWPKIISMFGKVLPWDHVSSGIIKEVLVSERKKSFEQEYTPDCFTDGCPDCGACARSEHYVKA